MPEKNRAETKNSDNNLVYILSALTLLFIVRVLPLLKAPLSFYGYDFGFYYYAASHAAWHWQDFEQIIWGGYNSLIFSFGYLVGIPAQITVSASYFLAAAGLGLSLYLLMKNFGKTTGVFTILLLACSLLQAESYSMFLWKNAVALPFLVLAIKYLMEKKYQAFAISALAVLLLHRTSAVMLVCVAGIYFVIELIKSKSYKFLFITLLASLLLLSTFYFLHPLRTIIENLLYNNNYYVRTGLFLENQNILALWWPSLLLATAGLIMYIKNKQHLLLLVFTGLCVAWVAFQLPFYRRILIYLDLSVICFAAYFLGQLNYSRKLVKIFSAIVIIFLCIQAANYIIAKQPLIYTDQVEEIKNFQQPPGFILIASADDAPWILAYSQNQRLGAPGLLEDPHTYEQWMDFWTAKNQREFISHYPRPLYVYQRSYHLPPSGFSSCLTPLSQNFSALDYNCIEKTPF